MKTIRKIFAVSFTIMFVLLLVACKSSNDDEIDTDLNESQNVKSDTVSTSPTEDDDTNNNDEELDDVEETELDKKEETQTDSNSDVQISSGDEAVQFLKEQLEEGKNEDISFGTDDKLLTDDKGSFYMVQLVDVPLRGSGKTGNLGYYKVYQNGTYEIFQVELPNINDKEVYLAKLNQLSLEIEQFRNNSDATTTVEIEEDESYIYELWDEELNIIYGILQEQLSEEEMNHLREEQRAWINYRDETAEEEAKKYEGSSTESLEYVVTLANVTKERCFELVEDYME